MHYPLLLIFVLLHSICTVTASAYQAIVIKPVIDLLGDYLPEKASTIYDTLGCAGASNNGACKRIHQLLFGQIVNVLEEINDQVKIAVPSTYYVVGDKAEKQNIFWTQKNGIMHIESLPAHTKNILLGTSGAYFFSLKKPVYIPLLKETLSAGTRFYVKEIAQNKKIRVYLFHSATQSLRELTFDQSDGILARTHLNRPPAEYRTKFVQLLREWASPRNGFIPYVWGGCSFTTHLRDAHFIQKDGLLSGDTLYDWPSATAALKTGFDCSGIILQAATMLGLPYYFKNSHTVMKQMAEVPTAKSIKNGDIIWIPRHVMVVADTQKATIIEARSYGHGFGKVQELPLNKLFQGIENFTALREAVKQNKRLQRLDTQQKPVQEITQVKILDLDALWPTASHTATAH